MRPLTTALLVTSLAACRCPIPVDADAQARALLETDRNFAALSAQTNPKTAFAAYLAPDGIMLPRRSTGAVEGYDSVIAAFGQGGDPGYRLLWRPRFAEVAEAGDMGWTWGQYRVLVGGQEISRGKYVNVWKKQPGGDWKVRADIGNQHPGD